MTLAQKSPLELYDGVKADFERLAQNSASRGEWIQLSYKLVEAIMRCQQHVLEKQKAVIAYARGHADSDTYRQARQESRDMIHVLDRLNELHHRIRMRIVE